LFIPALAHQSRAPRSEDQSGVVPPVPEMLLCFGPIGFQDFRQANLPLPFERGAIVARRRLARKEQRGDAVLDGNRTRAKKPTDGDPWALKKSQISNLKFH